MSAIATPSISEKEYLEQERKALGKSEYYQGEVFAMAEASKEHNKIVADTMVTVGLFLKGKSCAYFPSDLRIYNPANGLYTYPDLTVVCEEEKYIDTESDTLTNPTVIVEVLSPFTEDYDRGTKFKLYRSIPSLKNYVLISSTEYAAEVYTKTSDDNWTLTTSKGKESSIFIRAIDMTLQLADVYAQIDNWH